MKLFRVLATPCFALLFGVNAVLAASPEQQAVEHLVNDIALPAYTNWQHTNQAFHTTSEQFCAGKAELATVRAQWLAAQHAWLALQPVLVPPSPADHLGLQIQFWPDKRNLAAKQTEELLQKNTAITIESLTVGSVAVRGLSASEYMLFDRERNLADSAQRARYCPLLQANTAYQLAQSSRALQVWQQFAALLLQTPNARYADAAGPLSELLRAQVTAFNVMHKKLGVATGLSGTGSPQPYQAEAWRAGDTLGSLQAGVVASQALWTGSGWRALVHSKQPALAQKIDETYATLQAQLVPLQVPLERLLATEAGKQQLKQLFEQLNTLRLLYEKEVAKALNVQLGFNGTDGD
ncbi:MAG: imelysin family protein [Cellvibrionales bacterium]|jgi:predicted lipoprotein|nr:imelysin family protein [Cellvibrionales bacterium]